MKPENAPLDPQAVLGNLAWVQALARRLVRDPNVAEDVAQEAWVAALRHGAPQTPLRAWLGRVVRNGARQVLRREGVRRGHERAAARTDDLPSAGELVERAAIQRGVVDAVLGLEEPYRRTVFLRYFEGLSPAEIARRTDTPLATVKTRLRRGLALLRERLDSEHGGDGRTWALALVPLISRSAQPGPPAFPWLEALLMSTSMKVTLTIGAAAMAAVLWSPWRSGRIEPPVEAATAPTPPVELAPAEPLPAAAVEVVSAERTAVDAPHVPAPVAEGQLVQARVVDVDNVPVAGVAVGLRDVNGSRMEEGRPHALWTEDLPAAADAVSAADGSFALAIEEWPGALVSVDERWETVVAPVPRLDGENTLVVAPRFSLTGLARDDSGAPVPGARLVFRLPEDYKLTLDGTGTGYDNGWTTTSDDQGAFAFERLPSVDAAALRVRKDGFALLDVDRSPWSDGTLELTLVALAEWVEGTVRDPRGAPVQGAHVALGPRWMETAADGRFRLSLQDLSGEARIRAAAAGYLPASFEPPTSADGTDPRWPSSVELVLDEGTLSLTGRVTDAEGTPLPGLEVLLADPEGFHVQHDSPIQLESVLAGSPAATVEAETVADGRFELSGLQRRDYSLKVVDPECGLVLPVGPFAAGATDVEIVIPADAVWPQVRGRVVTRAGEPVADAGLTVSSKSLVVSAPGSEMAFQLQARGARTRTASDGSFVLPRVPRSGATLSCYCDGLSGLRLELTPDTNADDLELVLGAEVRVRLQLAEADVASYFLLLDANGERVSMQYDSSRGPWDTTYAEFVDGRSPVVSTSDAAVEVVVYDAEHEELLRVPVRLLPGAINELEL